MNKFRPSPRISVLKPAASQFVLCPTPQKWCEKAAKNIDILLLDHKNCEYKAANNALHLMAKYPEDEALCTAMARLAREELVHYAQVQKLLRISKIKWRPLSASRYGARLRDQCKKGDPQHKLDLLLLGSIIEARSCERFEALISYLETDLSEYYQRLAHSEARHFHLYLELAIGLTSDHETQERLEELLLIEADLIQSPDPCFRFHSGMPI
jgi:tRNA-(ms[2]io[6]A)-hydroxylase